MLPRALFCISLTASGSFCIAQNADPTLQLDFVHFEKLMKNEGLAPPAFRISYERLFDDRILYGIDVHLLYRNVFGRSTGAYCGPFTYNGWTGEGEMLTKEWGLSYRTGYFLTGDQDGGVYIGTSVGFRHVSCELEMTSSYYDPSYSYYVPDVPFKQHYSAEMNLYPVGIRVGMRGGYVYGFESDIYCGISYQIGSGNSIFSEPELIGVPTSVAPVVYSFGFAWLIHL